MTARSVLRRVGQDIRAARRDARLTQQQLAGMIGTSRSSLANLEAGNQEITVTRLAALAEALKLDIADLIRKEDAGHA